MRRRILSILLAAVLAGSAFFPTASAVTVLADTEAQEEAQSAEGEARASRAAELIREHKGYILEAIRTLRSYGLTPDAILHTTGELLRLPFAARTAEQDGGAEDAETESGAPAEDTGAPGESGAPSENVGAAETGAAETPSENVGAAEGGTASAEGTVQENAGTGGAVAESDTPVETAQAVSESAKEAVADSLKEAAEDVGEHARKRMQEVIAEAMRAAGQKAAEMARGAIDRGANGVKELFTGAVDNE